MSDPVWYYARGDVEKGPLSTAQIKALAAAGKIRPDDYVWKEGMDNWAPAGEISELLANGATKTPDKEKESEPAATAINDTSEARVSRSTRSWPRSSSMSVDPQRLPLPAGYLSLGLGLLTVLLARGCDALGNRYVARLNAMLVSAEHEFQGDWQDRIRELEVQIEPLRNKPLSQPEQQKLQKLTTQVSQLNSQMRAEESTMRQTRWRELESSAAVADADNQMWGFWRELAFLFGAFLLTVGALTIGLFCAGPERWFCWAALIAIIYGVCSGSI